MATSSARAALDAWFAQVDEVLRANGEPDAGQDRDADPVEHEDAA